MPMPSDQIDWPPSTPHHLTVPVPPARPSRGDAREEHREDHREGGDEDPAVPEVSGLVCLPVLLERPGLPPAAARLEAAPGVVRRLPPGPPPLLSGQQLAGTACLVCGAWLGLGAEAAGTVFQPLPGRRDDAAYLVVVHTDHCPPPPRGLPPGDRR